MFSAPLQGGQDIFLIAHRGNHDDACVAVLANDALHGFNAFHLRHGDVHQDDIRLGTVELGDGGETVASLARHFPAESLDHFDEVLAREYGVVYHQVADGFIVFALQSSELWHKSLLKAGNRVSLDEKRKWIRPFPTYLFPFFQNWLVPSRTGSPNMWLTHRAVQSCWRSLWQLQRAA